VSDPSVLGKEVVCMKAKMITSRTRFVDHDDFCEGKAPRFINAILVAFILLILLSIGVAVYKMMYLRW